MIGVLDHNAIEELLYQRHIGHLACVAHGRPYLVPITYTYCGDCIYGHTWPGRKITALRADPHACFQVEAQTGDETWRSVMADAEFEELTEPDELQLAQRALRNATPVPTRHPEAGPGVYFRLHLSHKTGRFIAPEI